jgi:polysaccharide biosynthesis/export protein
MTTKICAFCALLMLSLSACVSHKELLYLNDMPSDININETIVNQMDMQVQTDDLLAISVTSYNLDASKPFNTDANNTANMAQALQGANNVAEMLTGYFVDQEGFIDFPSVGRVYVHQKTLGEVKKILLEKLQLFLKDPVVNVRFLNLKISVLGEVTHPGTIRLTNKRLTIFEAIGLAGDMTLYSNRSNVLLIREKNGKRTVTRINLQSSKIFVSPYYYLQQNDVLYVEPNRTKVNTIADKSGKTLSFISSGVSVLALALTILLRRP